MTNFCFSERVSSYYRFPVNPSLTTTNFLKRDVYFLFNLCAFYVFCTFYLCILFSYTYIYLDFLIICKLLQWFRILYLCLDSQCLEHCLVCSWYWISIESIVKAFILGIVFIFVFCFFVFHNPIDKGKSPNLTERRVSLFVILDDCNYK